LSSALRRQRLDQGVLNKWTRSWSTTYRESGLTYIQTVESGQHLQTTRGDIFLTASASLRELAAERIAVRQEKSAAANGDRAP
jgi:hypothetical protein